jgi:hypothetical protein
MKLDLKKQSHKPYKGMYTDTSMAKQSLILRLKYEFMHRLENEERLKQMEMQTILKKRLVRKHYEDRFNIKLSHERFLKMSEQKIHKYFIQKQQKAKRLKAAILIQKIYRGFIFRKKRREHNELINSSSTKIQKCWRAYRRRTLVPHAWRQFKKNRITRIQKFLRGYHIYHKYLEARRQMKLKR